MPRLRQSDPLAQRVGARIRELRGESDLTLEKLAFHSDVSKGHLSSIEKGLVRPTINTLSALAGALDVHLLDLVTFPGDDERQALVDRTRKLTRVEARRLLRTLPDRTRRTNTRK